MQRSGIVGVALHLLALGSAHDVKFSRWNALEANFAANGVYRRQSTPPGYHPEFGSCGSGTTCENACGANWESCQASTGLSLFCYNKVDLGQSCCENGSGRACDKGFYCAWQEFGGRVWCCEDGQSLEDCGLPQDAITSKQPTSTAGTPSTSHEGGPSSSAKPTGSTTGTGGFPTTDSHCPAETVTKTVVSTVLVAATTVTVTEAGSGCSTGPHSSHSTAASGTSYSSWDPTTITGPPVSSATYSSWPPANGTSTSSIATAGASGLTVNGLGLAAALLALWV
ncbi:uncharacterized protein C8A04DRAFT_13401 [Dichotomopilus funicola]|uniref:Uncharacterized protein n=1 Tax=Dichotomopilus funicola TaxID=1934379 RepID=A0AAN6UZV0_9PEZI|nr:hypothetical protein C8A04DRAFT_13401 [Dichotomopilus funicola]